MPKFIDSWHRARAIPVSCGCPYKSRSRVHRIRRSTKFHPAASLSHVKLNHTKQTNGRVPYTRRRLRPAGREFSRLFTWVGNRTKTMERDQWQQSFCCHHSHCSCISDIDLCLTFELWCRLGKCKSKSELTNSHSSCKTRGLFFFCRSSAAFLCVARQRLERTGFTGECTADESSAFLYRSKLQNPLRLGWKNSCGSAEGDAERCFKGLRGKGPLRGCSSGYDWHFVDVENRLSTLKLCVCVLGNDVTVRYEERSFCGNRSVCTHSFGKPELWELTSNQIPFIFCVRLVCSDLRHARTNILEVISNPNNDISTLTSAVESYFSLLHGFLVSLDDTKPTEDSKLRNIVRFRWTDTLCGYSPT